MKKDAPSQIPALAKLDPDLNRIVQRAGKLKGGPETATAAQPADDDEPIPTKINILLQFTGDISDFKNLGYDFRSVGDVAWGTVSVAELETLAGMPNVLRIEISRPMKPELDVSIPDIKANLLHQANPAIKGAGVVVGVIDSGIDFRHKVFRKADEKTRLLSVWDQRREPNVDADGNPQAAWNESHPDTFSYGVELTQGTIDALLLQATPNQCKDDRIRDYSTDSGHGTHVAAIAAGNGLEEDACYFPGILLGVAPEADIIAVALDSSDNKELGESMHLLDAILYIFTEAKITHSKPAVINISQGDNLGPHDGTSLVEIAIDNFASDAGRAIVKSAGNEGDAEHHATGTVTAGATETIKFKVVSADRIDFDLWYDGGDRFDFSITPPGGTTSAVVAAGNNPPTITLSNNNTVSVNSVVAALGNNDNRIRFTLRKGTRNHIENGEWDFRLTGATVTDGTFHCWIDRDTEAYFKGSHLNKSHTISVPGTANKVITVGSYVSPHFLGLLGGGLSDFSSRGPTRDGRHKPEIVAPGQSVNAARSRCVDACSCCKYHSLQGTSMAAPHVAGVVALMLQKDPTLNIDQIRQALFDSVRTESSMGTLPNDEWGFGKVDAFTAVQGAPEIAPGSPTPSPTSLAPVGSPGDLLPQPTPILAVSPVLREIIETPMGRDFAQLGRRHFHEVRALINTNKRVAAYWRRLGGQRFLLELLNVATTPDLVLPTEMNGRPLRVGMLRLLAALKRHGSPPLKADIDRFGSSLEMLPGSSLNQLLERFRLNAERI